MLEKNSIVTVDLEDSNNISNTYIIKDILSNENYLLYHPLFPDAFIVKSEIELNNNIANLKCSFERSLIFANCNKNLLDYNTLGDLESLCLYFSIKRKVTPSQKQKLSSICGMIANIQFNDNIKKVMQFIQSNRNLLDEFNLIWFHRFKSLFSGEQPITSKKQKNSIFNIAGFLLAETFNPKN